MTPLQADKQRKGHMPVYQYFYRWSQSTPPLLKFVNRICYKLVAFFYHVEISPATAIGPGLFIGHPYGITVNPKSRIGKNCNIHKGVTIGQENRGKRKGAPVIGDCVWIGVNSTIVGNVTIGNDVLIAPNSYVNRDIPPHSVVFGNPCQIKEKENATEGYINNRI